MFRPFRNTFVIVFFLLSLGYAENKSQADIPQYRQVIVGDDYNCAISQKTDLVSCWGQVDKKFVEFYTALGPVAEIYHLAGSDLDCFLAKSGKLKCWNYFQAKPFIQTPEDIGDFAQISLGRAHICALTAAGKVRCWGENNEFGQLNVPAELGKVKDLRSAAYATCAVSTDDQLKCWGNSEVSDLPANLGAVEQLELSPGKRYQACAIQKETHEVICWGRWDQPIPPFKTILGNFIVMAGFPSRLLLKIGIWRPTRGAF